MNSIGENCTELKKEYDACFNAWFSEHFLKGNTDESICAPIFKVYQECVKRALKEQSIELDIEGDLDAEFRPPSSSSSHQQHGKHGS